MEDFLMHYGILGMKWGVRRYQNKDGSLTAAGKKRYAGSERNTNLEKTEAFRKLDIITESINQNSKRGIEASITGINALKAMYPGRYDDLDPGDEWDRIWFLCEDQTIGAGSIADLANRGKTYRDIKEIIQMANELSLDSNNYYTPGVFQLAVGNIPDEYITACINASVKKDELNHSDDYLMHYGILGMKWGVRRYQNEDGSLTPAGKRHLNRQDNRWLRKQDRTTTKKLTKKVMRSSTMRKYDRDLRKTMKTKNRDGSLNKNYVAAYNQGLAELMNLRVSELEKFSPSGMTLAFVAKRGDVGVFTALASPGYDMSQVRRGVNADGRIAYKKEKVGVAE